MNDWAKFTESVPWFLRRSATASVLSLRHGRTISQGAAELFPSLGILLAKATVTEVSVDGTHYELMAWNSISGCRTGWLCLPPSNKTPPSIFHEHATLLRSFGGIVERFNEPHATWLLNLNDALTEREAANDASFIEKYSWTIDDAGLSLPIEPIEYYSIAREANGNTTICNRLSGELLMFAPDHAYEHLKTLPGCPDYTLYSIDGAATFRDW